jgi:predicted RNA binding protein YcfA (HicA-like mRNA interferase family)
MPKKIRELKAMLEKAGFKCKKGKGSHTKWSHPRLKTRLVLSGKSGADAKPYQEQEVAAALKGVQNQD